ncbi:MAG: 1-acyl-sn-glycerol-3-phosphate acyltransferase [Desulfobacterales bacterium]|nr:MAG: 1-acyl-sn-glycerol-3-phosphate acyltransferase [Desulfobacterales bacterium]
MLRTLYVLTWVAGATFVLGSLAVVLSLFHLTGNPIHHIAALWAKSILAVSRIKVTVNGIENIDPQTSYIFMCNHQSNFDIPVILAHLPVQFRWLAKAELFKIPILSRSMRGAGYISIDRSNQESAFKSIKQAAQTVKDGVSVMIFPEGTRSRDGKIGPFKKGGFVLAVDSGVPIVPLIIHGTRAIMAKGGMRIKPGDVVLEIAKPIETGQYTRVSKEALMQEVRDTMCAAFAKGEKGVTPC